MTRPLINVEARNNETFVVVVCHALGLILLPLAPTEGFQLNVRWSRTATNPTTGGQGSPITLTWGFIADGTQTSTGAGGSGPSNLIASLDAWFGAGPGGSDLTQRPWFPRFSSSFDRFSQLSGLSYVYEPNDDGVQQTAGNIGFLGVRADVRIGGRNIDGAGGILAFNNFPDYGDMVFDTSDGSLFSQPGNNFRYFRNTIMHEHGHGVGLNHVESSDRAFLMEPFIQTTIDGIQYDDLLGIQRHYGDFYEKSNGGLGNNTFQTATSLGTVASGSTVRIGVHGGEPLPIPNTKTDFVSIDDDSDLDFYSFTITSPSTVNLILTPVGPTYMQGPQGGAQSQFVTSQLSNLALALLDTNGTTVLSFQDANGLGVAEQILNFPLSAPGTYYARATGSANQIQMYRLEISATATALPGDFNSDGLFNCLDIDALTVQVVNGTNPPAFDLTGDGFVNTADVTQWLSIAGNANLNPPAPYLPGDINLDGSVGQADINALLGNLFSSTPAWCSGDVNSDGVVDGSDFGVVNTFNGQSSGGGLLQIPEPQSGLLVLGLICLLARVRPRKGERI